MVYDLFVGDLTCPKCGAVTADSSSNIQMHLPVEGAGAAYAPGQTLELGPNSLADYLSIRAPAAGEKLRLLHNWECPACGEPFNWALVVLDGGFIESVAPAALTRAAFEAAHYILHEDGRNLAGRLSGETTLSMHRADILDLIRRHLKD